MTSIWRRHLTVCSCLGLLAIPIYFVDQALFDPAGTSNWIVLDFRGLLFWSYIIWLAIYLSVGSIAFLLFPHARKLRFQIGMMGLSLVLLAGGFLIYGKAMAWSTHHQNRMAMQLRRALFNVIELRDWSYYPNPVSPREIRVSVTVHDSGRFAGNVTGEQTKASGSTLTVFESVNQPTDQRQVSKGESFTYVFPVKILHEGPADNISITLYLFEAASGPATGDIAKVFSNSPHPEDDGHYFYATLPPPSGVEE